MSDGDTDVERRGKGPGGLLRHLSIAALRISSDQRTFGSIAKFNINPSQVINNAVGFYVHSLSIPNSWYNVDGTNNTSFWSIGAGPKTAITIPPGYYNQTGQSGPGYVDVGAALAQQIAIVLDGATPPFKNNPIGWNTAAGHLGQIYIKYNATFNKYDIYTQFDPFTVQPGPALNFWATNDNNIPGSMNDILGLTQDHTTNDANTNGVFSSDQATEFGEPTMIGVGSPQLRRRISLDSSQASGSNCFHHQPVTAPKLANIYYFNASPTELSVVQFGQLTTLTSIDLEVMNPQDPLNKTLALTQEWEMVIHVLVVSS